MHLVNSNLESNYCIGNINGEIICFKLENLNGFSLTEWASLKIDGWIWSDMKLIAGQNSLFVMRSRVLWMFEFRPRC